MKHADLTRIRGFSAAKVYEAWISNKRVETVCKEKGLDATKNLILSDLKEIEGKGISSESLRKFEMSIKSQRSLKDLMMYLWNSSANGANMGLS